MIVKDLYDSGLCLLFVTIFFYMRASLRLRDQVIFSTDRLALPKMLWSKRGNCMLKCDSKIKIIESSRDSVL